MVGELNEQDERLHVLPEAFAHTATSHERVVQALHGSFVLVPALHFGKVPTVLGIRQKLRPELVLDAHPLAVLVERLPFPALHQFGWNEEGGHGPEKGKEQYAGAEKQQHRGLPLKHNMTTDGRRKQRKDNEASY